LPSLLSLTMGGNPIPEEEQQALDVAMHNSVILWNVAF
jgi:hypothetical protein